MKLFSTLLLLFIINFTSTAQNKPTYPEPKPGFKRVDLLLPKIENTRDYKVEIQFSFTANVTECSNANFYFNPQKNIREEYGIAISSRFPYYVIQNDETEVFEEKDSNCKNNKKASRKIYSIIDYFIEYQGYYARPFYIPESWSLEYKIWKAPEKYNTIK